MDHHDYLHALGISVWRERHKGGEPPYVAVAPAVVAEPIAPAEGSTPISSVDWRGLQQCVQLCQRCTSLAETRTQTVFGMGARQAELLIISEAPGVDEDQQGEPFVGPNGLMLDQMLRAIGLSRGQVFITHIIKCRPPHDRDPHQDELAHCHPFLQRQIELIQPKLILAVGRIAAQRLLRSSESVGRLRGQLHRTAEGHRLVVTYHPAYLLRSPKEKRKVWHDLMLVHQSLKSP